MKQFIFSIVTIVLFATSSFAQTAPIDENGLAIGGYDVVAYFTGDATPGSATYTIVHEGATYQFSSKSNLETFKTSPDQYLPQFDGYCAWGVAAQDSKFPINPETFDIIDGKLYLFFNGPFKGEPFNTLAPWQAETSDLSKQAHAKWPAVKKS